MSTQQTLRASRYRYFKVISMALLTTLALLLLFARPLIDHLIIRQFSSQLHTYIQEFSLHKLHYQDGILHIEGLHIPRKASDQRAWDYDVFIHSIKIPCHYIDLWAGHFDKIDIRGLSLVAHIKPDVSISLGQLDHILSDTTATLAIFKTLDVQESSITLISSFGKQTIDTTFYVQHVNGRFSGIFTTGNFMSMTGSFDTDFLNTTLNIDIEQAPFLKRPLHVAMTQNNNQQNHGINLLVRDLQDKKTILKIKDSNQPDIAKRSIAIEGQVAPLSRFVDISSLLPHWHKSLTSLDGDIAIKGNLTWKGASTSLQGPLTIHYTKGNVISTQGTLQNVTGTLRFAQLNPLITPHTQDVYAEKATLHSLPLTHLKLSFTLSSLGEFTPTAFTAQTMGGEINAYGFPSFNDLRDGPFCELTFDNIRCEDLLTLMAFTDLKINAAIQGRANIQLKDATLQLKNAEFHSITPQGHLQYLSSIAINDAELQGDQLAFKALQNLYFTALEGKINSDSQSVGFQAQMKLSGFNPEVLQGYPFEFNLTATGALKELIQNTLHNLQPPKDLKEISHLFGKSIHKQS